VSLEAYWDGERIDRSLLSDSNIDAFRARSAGELTHPFCEHRVLPRSKPVDGVNLYHFMHDPREARDCVWAKESESHLTAKDLLVQTARSLGWNAVAEAGRSGRHRPDHIPDVLVTREDQRFVFEVQLSSQKAEVYQARQNARLAVPGTTSIWLTGSPLVPARVPWLPLYYYDPGTRRASTQTTHRQLVPLNEWVVAALYGQLALPEDTPEARSGVLEKAHRQAVLRAAAKWMKLSDADKESPQGRALHETWFGKIGAAGWTATEFVAAHEPGDSHPRGIDPQL
jgi:Holliday junction resolvase